MTRHSVSIAYFGLITAVACTSETRSGAARTSEANAAITTISHGESVELIDYLIAGQRTVFEYTADW